MDRHDFHSRTNVRAETTTTIILGQTTKEDIFLALGEPDESSPDGSRLIYRSTKVKAVIVFGYLAGDLVQTSDLIITFDERGVVLYWEFQEQPLRGRP